MKIKLHFYDLKTLNNIARMNTLFSGQREHKAEGFHPWDNFFSRNISYDNCLLNSLNKHLFDSWIFYNTQDDSIENG